MGCCTARVLGILSITGLFGTVIFRWGILDPVIHDEIAKKLVLEPGSELWDFWIDIPIPIYTRFFFFNVTNPDEIVRGAKPVVKEIGPYVYEEKRTKIIISSNDETVKFRPKVVYTFRRDMSVGSDDDSITMLNVPFVGLAKMAWKFSKSPLVLSTLDDTLTEKGEKLFHTHAVREYLFDGVSIQNFLDLLSLAASMGVDVNSFDLPQQLRDGDFGFFEGINATADDVWVVKTGKENLQDFSRTILWNGKKTMGLWPDPRCDKIDGSDGTLFPPFATKTSVLKGYAPQFCRTVEMDFKKPSEYMGIPTLRFGYKDSFLGSLKQYPENECYCKDCWEHCEKGGLFFLGGCLGGAPVFGSNPHFMGAHKDYIDGVIGLTPEGDYETTVDLEPHLGLPIRGRLSLQINMEVEPYSSMDSFANLPNVMMPILWAEETATVTAELAAPLKLLLHGLKFMDFLAYTMMMVFGVCLVIAIVSEGRRKKWHHKLSGK